MRYRVVWLVLGAVLIVCAALLLAKVNPTNAVSVLIKGSLGSPRNITGTLKETTPLLIAGVAVFIGLRAGLFNIGVEGQFLVGALASAAVCVHVSGVFGIVLGIAAAITAGALWAYPAGLIKAYRNGHEVITTIMLNNVAGFLTSYLVAGPLRDKSQGEPSTANISASTHIPAIPLGNGLEVSSGLLVGVAITFAISWWLRKRVAGYELQAVGANPTAARFAGIDPSKVIVRAMLSSGALAGFAGAVQVLAYEGRFYNGFSPGYGFDALGVALLAGTQGLAMIPSSLLFGILAKGGTSLSIEGVPKGITTVVLGFVILVAAAIRYRRLKAVA